VQQVSTFYEDGKTSSTPLFRETELHRQASSTLNSFVSSIPGAGLPKKLNNDQNWIKES